MKSLDMLIDTKDATVPCRAAWIPEALASVPIAAATPASAVSSTTRTQDDFLTAPTHAPTNDP
jgi:hypothetical protein